MSEQNPVCERNSVCVQPVVLKYDRKKLGPKDVTLFFSLSMHFPAFGSGENLPELENSVHRDPASWKQGVWKSADSKKHAPRDQRQLHLNI